MDTNKINDINNVIKICDESFEIEGDSFAFLNIQNIIEESQNANHVNSDECSICFDVNCDFKDDRIDVNCNDSSLFEDKKCLDVQKYFLEINLKKSGENPYSIANNLILDGCGKYSCDINQFLLDGVKFSPNIYKKGILENIYSINTDRYLEFSLCNILNNHVDFKYEEKADTSYGFKLSQIISNLGDLSQVYKNSNINEFGDIEFIQNAVIVSKCNRKHIIFSFKLKNVGNNTSSKILFKDVLPSNVNIYENAIFVNGKYINKESISICGRRVVIKFDDLCVGEEINLIMVGSLIKDCDSINCGVISYVDGFKESNGIKVMSIVQILSNIKTLKLKGCN